jgi:hypothetical protein
MTQTAARRRADNVHRRLPGWIVGLQQQLSDRIFADGDAFACENRWEITKTTGRFGFGTRTYRDPRFGQRAAAPSDSELSPSLRREEGQPQPASDVVGLEPPATMCAGWSAPQARHQRKKGRGRRTGG